MTRIHMVHKQLAALAVFITLAVGLFTAVSAADKPEAPANLRLWNAGHAIEINRDAPDDGTIALAQTPTASGDYDVDDNGLIEVDSIAQLDAIRWDLDGDGAVDDSANATAYAAAFPNAATGMGCASGCSGYELVADLGLPASSWTGIGSSASPFNATFDGGAPNYTISGIHIMTWNSGLFGHAGMSSVIRDVALLDMEFEGNIGTVGGLAGTNKGLISGSSVSGVIEVGSFGSGGNLGGLVGVNEGSISGSTATVDVTGHTGRSAYVGGLVGKNSGPISDSHALGESVVGRQFVGGLVGWNSGPISGSTATASAAAGSRYGTTGDNAGGLAGWNSGPISDSHASGDVSGYRYVGGLVGQNRDEDVANGNSIRWSTASGAVEARDDFAGGLVGWNNGPISDSDARNPTVKGKSGVGGLVGVSHPGAITRSTASANVSGRSLNSQREQNLGGLVGSSSGPISDSHASGDVQGDLGDWQIGGLAGASSGTITDSGASGNVSQVTERGGGLVGLLRASISGSIASGDVSGVRFIGGLVGSVSSTDTIRISESVASGDVTGKQYIGGLVGTASGLTVIESSHASGAVTSTTAVTNDTAYAGGLVGNNTGLIRNSHASGATTGVHRVGGLVGSQHGAIITSYASGAVTGEGIAIGGLVGYSEAADSIIPDPSSVLASYASGRVTSGSVAGSALTTGGLIGIAQPSYTPFGASSLLPGARFTSNYWDTQSSGQSTGVGAYHGSGVTGQTSSELRTPTGYTGIYAAWNVGMDTGDTVVAGHDPWDFGASSAYPMLRFLSDPPYFSTGTPTRTIAENAALGTALDSPITAMDSGGDTLTYRLVGAGGRVFSIDSATGQLQVGALLDHERRSTYTVTVQASDGKLVAFRDVEVTVTNANEPPSFAAAATVRGIVENSPAGTAIGAPVAATDPDGGTLRYTLSGVDAPSFAIDSSTGQLQTRADLDYEHRSSYAVTVQASVGSLSAAIDVAIIVIAGDDPAAVRLSSLQPQVGTALTATLADPDGSPSVTDWGWEISTDGATWTVISGETSASYTPLAADESGYLRVTATYSDAFATGKTAHFEATNTVRAAPTGTNNAPTFPATETGGRSVAENSSPAMNIGAPVTATDTDSGDILTYSLSGSDDGSFNIGSATGHVKTKAALNVETKASYSVTVVATDPSLTTATQAVTITITGVNETPAVSGASEVAYAENGSASVGAYTATDPEGATTIMWELAGADSDDFVIANGVLSFSATPDHEAPSDAGRDNIYHVTVSASDGTNTGMRNVRVSVTDVDETPTVSGPVTASYPENSSGAVAAYTVDDPEHDTITWSLAGDDADDFEISANGILQRLNRTPRDYESPTGSSGGGNVYEVTVHASDGANTGSLSLTVTVDDVEEQPVVSGPARVEYTENGVGPVGTYRASDPEGLAVTWASLAGPDADDFDFSSNGELSFKTPPDHDIPGDANQDNIYEVRVQASDTTALFGVRDVAITPTDVNEPPTLSGDAVVTRAEGDSLAVASYTATDPEGATIDWSLSGSDSGDFTIAGGVLAFTAAPNHEVTPIYQVTVQVADGPPSDPARLTETLDVTVNVTDVNEPPALSGDAVVTRAEGDSLAVASYTATDPEGATVFWSLSGSDSGDFTIAGGVLAFTAAPNHEVTPIYQVTVQVADGPPSDPARLTETLDVTVNVTDVNEPPALSGDAVVTRAEGDSLAVASYTATDPEGATIFWSLSGSDSGDFTIAGGVLAFTAAPNHEVTPIYQVTVQVADGPPSDPARLTERLDVTVNVTDVDEPPEISGPETINDYAENGTGNVATYTATDPEGATIFWSLSGSDSGDFTIARGRARLHRGPQPRSHAHLSGDRASRRRSTKRPSQANRKARRNRQRDRRRRASGDFWTRNHQ